MTKMLADLAEDFPLTNYGAKFVSIAKGWAANKLHVYQVANQSEQIIRDAIRNFTHHATITDMAKRLEAADALLREAVEWNWLDDWVSDMHELDGRIQAHLQESGE